MKLEIDTRTFVRFWLIISGLVLAAFLMYKAQTGLLILGISVFLALALNGPVSLLVKRLPSRSRVLATALSYLAVITALGAIIFLVIPPIVQQTAKFAQNIPSTVENLTQQWQGLRYFVDEYNLQPQLDGALESIRNSAAGWAGNVGQSVIDGIGSVFAFIAALILVLVLTFLMLIEGPHWLNKIWSLYRDNDKMKRHRNVMTKMYKTVNGYVTGQLAVSTIGATTAGLTVFILSLIFSEIPAGLSMPTAAITFVLSLIPMFGATIGGVIITALLAFNAIPAAIIYAVYFVVYQQVENNFISPHIQAKRIELSPLAVLVAVTLGLYMFGVLGGIIAIPIAGCIRILLQEYLDRRASRADTKPRLAKSTKQA